MAYASKRNCNGGGLAIGLIAAAVLSTIVAVPAEAGEIRVTNATAHVMEDSVNGRRIEIYMTIENTGDRLDRLYAVRSRLGKRTALAVVQGAGRAHDGVDHASAERSDMAKHMRTSTLDIRAGETASLRHGGSHIMLMQPKEFPAPGVTFPVTLFFEHAGRLSVDVTVEAGGEMKPTNMAH